LLLTKEEVVQRGGTWSTGVVYELRLWIMLNEGRQTKTPS